MLKNWLFLISSFVCTLPITEVTAQIIPDNTLGIESSIITPADTLNDSIRGGATRGGNLFHSFTEFNIGEGRGVDFVNANSIENIITRVTGSNVSNIFGRLGARGEANLFFINPNGIVFGEGAILDIGGSFYGSTADSVLFPDNVEFSATNPQKPLLTINQPIGLVFGNNPGDIINRSNFTETEVFNAGTDFEFTRITQIGLKVDRGKDLALIGGDVLIENSAITASEGRVTLGGLSEAGIVQLNEDNSFIFPEVIKKADVSLITNDFDRQTKIAITDGFININANNLVLDRASMRLNTNGSLSKATTENINLTADSIYFKTSNISFFGEVIAGDINLAADSISFAGSSISSGTSGEGIVGDINLTADSISFADSSISSGTSGEGIAGDINLTANSISFAGSSIFSGTSGEGIAGDINLTANSISFEFSRIFHEARNIGDINLTANSISFEFSRISSSGAGTIGDISLTADSIALTDSLIESEISNEGGIAGDINLTADSISLIDSRILFRFRNAEGIAGDINLTADSISLTRSWTIKFEIPEEETSFIIETNYVLPKIPLNLQLTQTCTPGTSGIGSKFVYIGRGGIAPDILEALQINPIQPDWVEVESEENQPSESNLAPITTTKPTQIIEAQGWIQDDNGKIILVADAVNVTPHDSWQKPKQCNTQE